MKKIKPGQVLYTYSLEPVTVEKVGRKYFYVEGGWQYKGRGFEIETLKYTNQMYSQDNIQLYLTQQEILCQKEFFQRLQKIKHSFSHYSRQKFSLDQLRQVCFILNLDSNEN